MSQSSIGARRPLYLPSSGLDFFDIAATDVLGTDSRRLPISLRILLENLLRHEDGISVTRDDIAALAHWPEGRHSDREVAFRPARVLMPDSSGAPLLADLSAMRDAMLALGQDPQKVNPVIPVDLVVDHSVLAEYTGSVDAFRRNIALEFEQNHERYAFLRWAQNTYKNMRIVPPGSGIVHQINIEYLARPVQTAVLGTGRVAFPDTLVGMDSHTPMVNGLGVFGWGVGGIEAASAMLGEPISMLIPDVVGCRLVGRLRAGVTSTDLALTVVQKLRAMSVVGKLIEFYGPGLASLALPDRATIANMAPEYGATMGFFPLDEEAVRYLVETGRDASTIALVEDYARIQGLWAGTGRPEFSATIEIDLSEVETSLAGPKRPHDRIPLSDAPRAFATVLEAPPAPLPHDIHSPKRPMRDGDVIIAAITSCTNTANPSVMIRAGLLARNAVERGLKAKRWVKTSLSPGSRVVTDYLVSSGLQDSLDALGFQLAGYGCMTCSGGSGSLATEVTEEIKASHLKVATVLSGNRNFEGRIHSAATANFLASPPLVVAYALAGSISLDLRNDPLGISADGEPVFLGDIWPDDGEVQNVVRRSVLPELFTQRYASIAEGSPEWQALPVTHAPTFSWQPSSTYLRQPPFFESIRAVSNDRAIERARILAVLGDNITTDHISPGGSIAADSEAGRYLIACGVQPRDFNNYLSRRGNHDVMIRGTFANPRFRNEMAPGHEGGMTAFQPSGELVTIYEAAMRYARAGVPLVVVAGADYGTGSSRDWAAKGPALLGVRAVIAESFERIHRSNLVGMGILPLEFTGGDTSGALGIDGSEVIDILSTNPGVRSTVAARITRPDGRAYTVNLLCRIDTAPEQDWYDHGGILPFVLKKLAREERDSPLSTPSAPIDAA